VGAAGRGAQDDELAGRLGGDEQLLEQAGSRASTASAVPPRGAFSSGTA
jgi:hypothetical protein